MIQIEVCCFSLADCHAAQQAGANRIELCSGLSDGGLTPSAGLIQLVNQQISLPVWVMIRPRGGDFVYNEEELAVMQADIQLAKQAGVNGLVLGCLNPNGTVDERITRQLIELAAPLPVTFHRAFDLTHDPFEGVEAIIRTGAVRILTSGQQPTAEAGANLLRALTRQAAGRIEIMAGAGVNAHNAKLLAETGVDALHLSGQQRTDSPMQFRSPTVRMASAVQREYDRIGTSEERVSSLIAVLSASA